MVFIRRHISFLIALVLLTPLAVPVAQGSTEITLDSMTGLYVGDSVWGDSMVKFIFRLTYATGTGDVVTSFSNGFRIWTHRNSVYSSNFTAITYDTFSLGWSDRFDLVFSINTGSVDGMEADTVTFGGIKISGAGIPDSFDTLVWWIATTPSADGDTLCTDSSFFPPAIEWLWATTAGIVYPGWWGPYCFHVYRSSSGIESNSADLPTAYSLSQNYPNPFNSHTQIRFQLRRRIHTTLTVYNILGQKITTLVNEEMQAGRYVAVWDGTADGGRAVASGVYLYKLKTAECVEVRKMVLLR